MTKGGGGGVKNTQNLCNDIYKCSLSCSIILISFSEINIYISKSCHLTGLSTAHLASPKIYFLKVTLFRRWKLTESYPVTFPIALSAFFSLAAAVLDAKVSGREVPRATKVIAANKKLNSVTYAKKNLTQVFSKSKTKH